MFVVRSLRYNRNLQIRIREREFDMLDDALREFLARDADVNVERVDLISDKGIYSMDRDRQGLDASLEAMKERIQQGWAEEDVDDDDLPSDEWAGAH